MSNGTVFQKGKNGYRDCVLEVQIKEVCTSRGSMDKGSVYCTSRGSIWIKEVCTSRGIMDTVRGSMDKGSVYCQRKYGQRKCVLVQEEWIKEVCTSRGIMDKGMVYQ